MTSIHTQTASSQAVGEMEKYWLKGYLSTLGLNENRIEHYCSKLLTFRINAHESLQDDPGSKKWWLQVHRGMVKIETLVEGCKPRLEQVQKANGSLVELNFYKSTHGSQIRAVKDSAVTAFDLDIHLELCAESKNYMQHTNEMVCFYGITKHEAFNVMRHASSEIRVFYSLMVLVHHLMHPAYSLKKETLRHESSMLILDVTQQELADISGLSRPVVNRILGKFDSMNLLARNRSNIFLPDAKIYVTQLHKFRSGEILMADLLKISPV